MAERIKDQESDASPLVEIVTDDGTTKSLSVPSAADLEKAMK